MHANAIHCLYTRNIDDLAFLFFSKMCVNVRLRRTWFQEHKTM